MGSTPITSSTKFRNINMKEKFVDFITTLMNIVLVVIGVFFLIPLVMVSPLVLISVYCASLSFRCVKSIKG